MNKIKIIQTFFLNVLNIFLWWGGMTQTLLLGEHELRWFKRKVKNHLVEWFILFNSIAYIPNTYKKLSERHDEKDSSTPNGNFDQKSNN